MTARIPTQRGTSLYARLWWWLLPYAGTVGYHDPELDDWTPTPLERLGDLAWRIVNRLPGSVWKS